MCDVVERGVIVVSERRHGVSVVVVSGVVVTERAPSGVASSPRLASSPERAVVVAECAPSITASLLSGVVSSPERGVVAIVAAIVDGATTKRCFVLNLGVGVTRIGNKYLLGGENEWPGVLSMAGKA